MIGTDSDQTSDRFNDHALADYEHAADFLKSGCQIVFAGNGGSALAVLTFMTAIVKENQQQVALKFVTVRDGLAASVATYLVGVLLAAAALICFSLSKERWGYFWEQTSLTGFRSFDNAYARQGDRFRFVGYVLFSAAASAFVLGTGIAVWAIVAAR